MRPIDQDVLPKEFAADAMAHFVAGGEDFDELAKGSPMFHWFILAAVAFLLLESGFQFLLRRKAGMNWRLTPVDKIVSSIPILPDAGFGRAWPLVLLSS